MMKSDVTPLSILQWNMGESHYSNKVHPNPSKLAHNLLSLLAENDPTVVTLQEVKSDTLSLINIPKYETVRGEKGLVVLIKKGLFVVKENKQIRKRVQVVSLNRRNTLEPILKIINLHLPALWLTDAGKREKLRIMMPDINRWRIEHEPRYEIVSGDFNMPPYGEMLISETGFFANRDLVYASKRRGTLGRGLYNSSWNIFGGTCGATGTFYHDSFPDGPWHVPDQTMLDPRLMINTKVEVSVITKTKSESLADKGFPNKEIASDHFPVLINISQT